MIIFLVLIIILILLIATFIYLNKNNYYKIKPPQTAKSGTDGSYFSPDSDYFTLVNTWTELTEGSVGIGAACFYDSMCNGYTGEATGSVCMENPDTGQRVCFSSLKDGQSKGFVSLTEKETAPINYGVNTLFTAICAQADNDNSDGIVSYYPNYKDSNLIKQAYIDTPQKQCKNIKYVESPNITEKCYDVDQLSGTRIVEMCKATPNTNQICIDNNGDRVYAPTMNPLYIKPSSTLCEDNTSINYITFNYNKMPQTINVMDNDIQGSLFNDVTINLWDNQLFCLSVDSITYHPTISINQYQDEGKNSYYLSFTGTWGYQFNYIVDSGSNSEITLYGNETSITWYDTNTGLPAKPEKQTEIQNKLTLDNNYGITYVIPSFNIKNDGFTIDGKTKVYSFSENIDLLDLDYNNISSSISLQPCAMFDTSYNSVPTSGRQTLENYYDNQKFKISRFTMSKGEFKANPSGMVSSIVYRNLNYENGGLYLDYYTPPSSLPTSSETYPSYIPDQTESLILRKVNPNDLDSTKKWLLMPPIDLSPYSIPSGENMWCNFSTDVSTNGGVTFNGKNSAVVPMKSIDITPGTEIIDPVYDDIVKQPDNKIFNIVGDSFEAVVPGLVTAGLANPVVIYQLVKTKGVDWHLLKTDQSFGKCSQICAKRVSSIPQLKAVAMNSGTLGSVPPGHIRGLTQEFAQGNVIAGFSIGGDTCQNYYLYDPSSLVTSISERNVGDIYKDGNVEFVVKSTYDDTFLFTTSYFNNKDVISIDSITSGGLGYGTEAPKNVIIQLSPVDLSTGTSSPQKFQFGTTSKGYDNYTTECSIKTSTTDTLDNSECTISSISNTNLCKPITASSSTNLVNVVTSSLTKLTDWYIEVNNENVPLSLVFSSESCNSLFSLENYYTVSSSRVDFTITDTGNTTNIVLKSKDELTKYFPSVSNDNKPTTYQVYRTSDQESLYDTSQNPLELFAYYGDFITEYRLYNGNTDSKVYLANLEVTIDQNSKITKTSIVKTVNEGALIEAANNKTTCYIYEYQIVDVSYSGIKATIEYDNTPSSQATVTLKDGTDTWEVTKPAPRNLIGNPKILDDFFSSEQVLSFNSTEQPLSLLNNSILKHGSSPQQIAYAGSFQDQDKYCFNTYTYDPNNPDETVINDCNNDLKCSFNTNLGYCQGKNLIEYTSEIKEDPFTLTENFNGSFFNDLKSSENTIFTDLDYIKTLQIKELNYQEYKPFPNQSVEGAQPTFYYTPPNFVNYQMQGIDNFGKSTVNLMLGKFIPYEYFYPNYIASDDVDQDDIQDSYYEASNLKLSNNDQTVNNFYINLNYTQFIPYGKKSLYENGFTKSSDVPTF